MDQRTYRQLQALYRMSVGQLRERYLTVFGEETRSHNKDFLRKRISWRIQACSEGGLSERARRRAEEIVNEADLRIRIPRDPLKPGFMDQKERSATSRLPQSEDRRLPPPGTLLIREFQGRDIVVTVRDAADFEYEGQRYKSLSAIARKVTGSRWNGYLFFRLTQPKTASKASDKGER